jgi:hypothetical protein
VVNVEVLVAAFKAKVRQPTWQYNVLLFGYPFVPCFVSMSNVDDYLIVLLSGMAFIPRESCIFLLYLAVS